VIAGITSLVYARASRIAHAALDENLKLRANTLASALEIERQGIEFEIAPRMVPEFQKGKTGAYVLIVDSTGKEVIRSPSLAADGLAITAPWVKDEYRYEDLDPGPDGIPCATVTLSFVVRVQKSKKWTPPPADAERRYQIRIALDSRPRDEGLLSLALFLAIVSGAALVVTGGGGLLLARRVLRPVRRMTAEAALLTPGDTTRRLDPDTVVKELHSLGTTLNSALDRLADALERQRQFTSDAGHELRTPVSVLLGNAELLLRRTRTPEEYQEGLARQHRIAHRMKDITENLLTLARADTAGEAVRQEIVRPADVLSSMCDEFRMLARENGVHIRCEVDEEIRVIGDPGFLGQLVQNLLSNALKFTAPGGTVSLDLLRDNGEAVLSIADDGPGIPEEHQRRIFDRFYRVNEGKDRREGAGLGLAIVAWVARSHGGKVSVDCRNGSGTTFEVRLPISRPEQEREHALTETEH
jgi:heavy metal sensor kinase